ncbi:MAG: hypothetical protein M5R41_17930 [Bacteroidia bacterium]|nr:hypothetical protein [Bacteroidia bacterium]
MTTHVPHSRNSLRSGRWLRRQALVLPLLPALLLALASCDEPVEPVPPPPHVQQDTTSHEIEWTVYRFGPGIPSSSLRDIIAFSDTNVWAVGGVYPDTPDTGALGKKPYTVLHWNGREWKKFKVPMQRCTSQNTFFSPFEAIAGNANDLWLGSSAGEGARWDGVNFYPACIMADSSLSWGAACKDILHYSENEVYFAGDLLGIGEITKYTNGRYSRISTFPYSPVTSLAGDGKGNLWAGGYDYNTGKGSFVWRTPDGTVRDIRKRERIDKKWEFGGALALWISHDSLYASVAGYLYIQSLYDTTHYRYLRIAEADPTRGAKVCIAGLADNDVFLAGSFCTVVHYNGKSLRSYPELTAEFDGGRFYQVSLTRDHVYLCGYDDQTRAIAVIGKRRH